MRFWHLKWHHYTINEVYDDISARQIAKLRETKCFWYTSIYLWLFQLTTQRNEETKQWQNDLKPNTPSYIRSRFWCAIHARFPDFAVAYFPESSLFSAVSHLLLAAFLSCRALRVLHRLLLELRLFVLIVLPRRAGLSWWWSTCLLSWRVESAFPVCSQERPGCLLCRLHLTCVPFYVWNVGLCQRLTYSW